VFAPLRSGALPLGRLSGRPRHRGRPMGRPPAAGEIAALSPFNHDLPADAEAVLERLGSFGDRRRVQEPNSGSKNRLPTLRRVLQPAGADAGTLGDTRTPAAPGRNATWRFVGSGAGGRGSRERPARPEGPAPTCCSRGRAATNWEPRQAPRATHLERSPSLPRRRPTIAEGRPPIPVPVANVVGRHQRLIQPGHLLPPPPDRRFSTACK